MAGEGSGFWGKGIAAAAPEVEGERRPRGAGGVGGVGVLRGSWKISCASFSNGSLKHLAIGAGGGAGCESPVRSPL